MTLLAPSDNPRLAAEERAAARWQSAGMNPTPHTDFVAFQRSKALSETTIRNRSSFIRGLESFTGSPAHEATLAQLRAYLGRPDVTPGTRRTERNAFRAFFDFLHEDGYRDDNPGQKLAVVSVPKAEPRPFTAAQIDAMLVSGAYKRTRAMILLGYYQGLRVSSIARVHGKHFDHLGKTISVVGKGNKERLLPLHPMIEELAHFMPPNDWWFPARRGGEGHITGNSVTTLITKAKIRAGITDPKLTPHSLRHAFGSDLVEEGLDIRVVQELMMHEDISSTQIYTRVSERRKREGIELLRGRSFDIKTGRRPAA